MLFSFKYLCARTHIPQKINGASGVCEVGENVAALLRVIVEAFHVRDHGLALELYFALTALHGCELEEVRIGRVDL